MGEFFPLWDILEQGWANSALRGICVSKTVSRAHVVDNFLLLLLRVTMLFWLYAIRKCNQRIFILSFLHDSCQTLKPLSVLWNTLKKEQFGNVMSNIWSCNSMHYCGVCILIELECYYRASSTVLSHYFWSFYFNEIKSVTHQQAGWHVVTLPVQAIHYIIWFWMIHIDVSIMYMCLC